jgi:hypothetical protein
MPGGVGHVFSYFLGRQFHFSTFPPVRGSFVPCIITAFRYKPRRGVLVPYPTHPRPPRRVPLSRPGAAQAPSPFSFCARVVNSQEMARPRACVPPRRTSRWLCLFGGFGRLPHRTGRRHWRNVEGGCAPPRPGWAPTAPCASLSSPGQAPDSRSRSSPLSREAPLRALLLAARAKGRPHTRDRALLICRERPPSGRTGLRPHVGHHLRLPSATMRPNAPRSRRGQPPGRFPRFLPFPFLGVRLPVVLHTSAEGW